MVVTRARIASRFILGSSPRPLDEVLEEEFHYPVSPSPPAFAGDVLAIAADIRGFRQVQNLSKRMDRRVTYEYHRLGLPHIKSVPDNGFLNDKVLRLLNSRMFWYTIFWVFVALILLVCLGENKKKEVKADINIRTTDFERILADYNR